MVTWAQKNSGKANDFGFTAKYTVHKTETINPMTECDPERPDKCPADRSICVGNKIEKID